MCQFVVTGNNRGLWIGVCIIGILFALSVLVYMVRKRICQFPRLLPKKHLDLVKRNKIDALASTVTHDPHDMSESTEDDGHAASTYAKETSFARSRHHGPVMLPEDEENVDDENRQDVRCESQLLMCLGSRVIV